MKQFRDALEDLNMAVKLDSENTKYLMTSLDQVQSSPAHDSGKA